MNPFELDKNVPHNPNIEAWLLCPDTERSFSVSPRRWVLHEEAKKACQGKWCHTWEREADDSFCEKTLQPTGEVVMNSTYCWKVQFSHGWFGWKVSSWNRLGGY
jgi:hypothetical protein